MFLNKRHNQFMLQAYSLMDYDSLLNWSLGYQKLNKRVFYPTPRIYNQYGLNNLSFVSKTFKRRKSRFQMNFFEE